MTKRLSILMHKIFNQTELFFSLIAMVKNTKPTKAFPIFRLPYSNHSTDF